MDTLTLIKNQIQKVKTELAQLLRIEAMLNSKPEPEIFKCKCRRSFDNLESLRGHLNHYGVGYNKDSKIHGVR